MLLSKSACLGAPSNEQAHDHQHRPQHTQANDAARVPIPECHQFTKGLSATRSIRPLSRGSRHLAEEVSHCAVGGALMKLIESFDNRPYRMHKARRRIRYWGLVTSGLSCGRGK